MNRRARFIAAITDLSARPRQSLARMQSLKTPLYQTDEWSSLFMQASHAQNNNKEFDKVA
jgi:hypothetical protein